MLNTVWKSAGEPLVILSTTSGPAQPAFSTMTSRPVPAGCCLIDSASCSTDGADVMSAYKGCTDIAGLMSVASFCTAESVDAEDGRPVRKSVEPGGRARAYAVAIPEPIPREAPTMQTLSGEGKVLVDGSRFGAGFAWVVDVNVDASLESGMRIDMVVVVRVYRGDDEMVPLLSCL